MIHVSNFLTSETRFTGTIYFYISAILKPRSIVMCLNIGKPKNHQFSIWDKWKDGIGVPILKHIRVCLVYVDTDCFLLL